MGLKQMMVCAMKAASNLVKIREMLIVMKLGTCGPFNRHWGKAITFNAYLRSFFNRYWRKVRWLIVQGLDQIETPIFAYIYGVEQNMVCAVKMFFSLVRASSTDALHLKRAKKNLERISKFSRRENIQHGRSVLPDTLKYSARNNFCIHID
jgi:hypothetical protein